MLQSGELGTNTRIDWLAGLIRRILRETNDGLRIVISIGELSRQDYQVGVPPRCGLLTLPFPNPFFRQTLFDAGARRTLTRIETSNPKLYAKMHPRDHSWEARVQVLRHQSEIGYMMGTGVLVGPRASCSIQPCCSWLVRGFRLPARCTSPMCGRPRGGHPVYSRHGRVDGWPGPLDRDARDPSWRPLLRQDGRDRTPPRGQGLGAQ